VKLFVARLSPNCVRVLLVKESIELPVEVVDVDLRKGANKEPSFLAINPNHKVPALQDGDYALWESNAINQYLAARAGRTDLWPLGAGEQADVSRWQFWTHTHWNTAANPIVYERVLRAFFGQGASDEAVVAAKLPELREALKVLDDHLATRRWLSLDRLTLADFSLAASMTYALRANLPFSEYPHFEAWLGRIRELPVWKKALPPQLANE